MGYMGMIMMMMLVHSCMGTTLPRGINRQLQHQPNFKTLHKWNQLCLELNTTSVLIRPETRNTFNKTCLNPPGPFCPPQKKFFFPKKKKKKKKKKYSALI